MKRAIVLLLAVIGLFGCATGPPPLDWDYTVDAPDQALKVVVVHVHQHYQVFRGYEGFEGIAVSIQNTTSQPIVINWNKSALEYDGTSHRVFITGQKYIDAGKDIPDRVIGAGSRIDVDIFPAESPYFESGTYGG
jgi:hypothetical protein